MKYSVKAIWFLIILLFFNSCKKENGPNPITDYLTYSKGEGLIGAGGGEIILIDFGPDKDTISIKIPAGALDSTVFISIRDIKDNLSGKLKSSQYYAFEFLPDGLVFSIPFEGQLSLSNFENGETFEFLQFNQENGFAKKEYSSFNREQKQLNFSLTHFSTYLVTTIKDKLSDNKEYTYDLINPPSIFYYKDKSYNECLALTRADVKRAFERWGAYSSTFGTSFTNNSNDPDISIMFISACEADKIFLLQDILGCDSNNEASNGICLFQVFGDKMFILLNDDIPWVSTDVLSKIYDNTSIEGTVIHEIGHLFGLPDKYKIKEFSSEDGCHNYLSVMGNYYCERFPLSIFKYDLEMLKDKYNVNNLDFRNAVSLKAVSGTSLFSNPNDYLTNVFQVKVVDDLDQGVKNVTVVFHYANQEIGTISNSIDVTDEEGIAKVDSWRLPTQPNNFTITAQAWLDPVTLSNNMDCPQSQFDIKRSITFNVASRETDPNAITDIDGNDYKTITIGTQTWMKENLRVTKYTDNTNIPIIEDNASWTELSSPGYCWHSWDIENKNKYGALYNWYAVNTEKLCPNGWHVPDKTDWEILLNKIMTDGYLGLEAKALKSTAGWNPGNGIDIYGFSVLPAGDKEIDCCFMSNSSRFWSSTPHWHIYIEGGADYLWLYNLYDFNTKAANLGASIRCIKN